MENRVQGALSRTSTGRGWVGAAAIILLMVACGGDKTTPPVTVVDAGVDTKPPKAPLPMPCVLKLDTPVKSQHVTGALHIQGTASHLSLGMNSAEAGLSPLFDDGSNPSSVIIGSKSNDDWADDSFAWDFDVSSLATGEWALTIKAWADPNPEYPSQSQGSCSIQVKIFVDNACPVDEIEEPKDGVLGGNYFQTMPVNITLDDDTGIESAHIEDDSGEVLYELEVVNEGVGPQSLNTVLEVCLYGTGVVAFNLVITDHLGNSCTRSLLPNIIRCPLFSGAHEVAMPEDVIAKSIVRADLDGDGRKDIVAATDNGVVWFRNDSDGSLGEAALVPDISGALIFVQPTDLNGDNKTDLIVAEKSGTKSKILVYLAGIVCKPDPEWDPGTVETDVLEGLTYPTVCEDGYGLAQEIPLPTTVTAHLLHNLAADPDVVGASTPTNDLVVGTHTDGHALVVMLGVEGSNDISGANGVPWCSWWQPTWNGLGTELPKPDFTVSKCFRSPMVFPSVGGINSLAAADYVEDENNAVDLIATRGGQGLLTVYKNDGQANFKTPYSIFLPAPATNIIPQLFNIEPEGVTATQHVDAMFLIPSMSQIWTIYGDGTGNWLTAFSDGMNYVARRVTCVEGEPSDVVMEYLDETAGLGTATLDLLVTNKQHGTLMTFSGGPLNQSAGARFDAGSIVDAVTEPKQVVLNYVNDDVYHDAVVLRGDGKGIGVVYGADPTKSATDPDYGPLGTFVGVNHIPTVIPQQPLSAYHVCDVTNQPAVSGQPDLGTADNRLAPAFMAIGDFINDVQNRPDLVMVTEMSHSTTGCDPVSLECPPRQPILSFRWDNKYQIPNALAQVSESIPYYSFCVVNGDEPCEIGEENYGEKSDTTAVAMGNFDFKSGPDLVLTTATSSPTVFEAPELPTIEILENDKQGLPHQGSFRQHTKATNNLELLELPGLWTDYGIHVGSQPVSVAAIHCQGVFSDPLTDFAVLGSYETEEDVWPLLTIIQSKGNSYQRYGNLEYFDLGQKPIMVRAALFGSAQAVGGEDTISDLAVVTTKAVYVYEGQPNCIFQRIAQLAVGSDPLWVAVGDLNDDTFAELVVPLADGTLTVAYGIDGSYWTSPVKIVPADDVTFGQVEIADLNGDGFPDVAAYVADDELLYIYVNNGHGEMNKVLPYVQKLTAGTSSFSVFDINDNQCMDLFALSPGAKAIGVFRSRASILGGCVHVNTITP